MLHGAIDYAGLYPPASLAMWDAVTEFEACRASADAWALGRFVVAASRLDELAGTADACWHRDVSGRPWRLAALIGADIAADVAAVGDFNDRHATHAVVVSLETRVSDAVGIRRAAAVAPAGVRVFAELPPDADFTVLARAAHDSGVAAKFRTGGITVEAFPTAVTVARFLEACRDAAIACKATAGLHHPLRGEYPLTYDADSVRGPMFGYMNVLLAATLVVRRASSADVVAMLTERDPSAVRFDDDGVRWRDTLLPVAAIEAARAEFVRGFGSCSFREPVGEGATLAHGVR